MTLLKFTAGAAAAALLAACAQQEEPTMVRPQPVFDKFGEGSCEGEWIYIPGTVPQYAECVPPEDCEMIVTATGQTVPCPPPTYRRPVGSNDGTSGGSGTSGQGTSTVPRTQP